MAAPVPAPLDPAASALDESPDADSSAWALLEAERIRQRLRGGAAASAAAAESARRPPRRVFKTTLAALLLFALGSVMLWLGITSLHSGERDRGIACCAVGALTFLPGAYASWVVLGDTLGWRGYRVEDLPSYDD